MNKRGPREKLRQLALNCKRLSTLWGEILQVNLYLGKYCLSEKCICVNMCIYIWASLVAQIVNNLPAVWETGVQSLG